MICNDIGYERKMIEYVDFYGMKMKVPQENIGGAILEGALLCLKGYEGPLNTIIDIGAHAGGFSVYAAIKGAKKVYAYEADSNNFECLKENITTNNLEGVITPYHLFVASRNDELCPLYEVQSASFGFNSGMHSRYWDHNERRLRGYVKSIAFKDILNNFRIIDYLKIDVEGAEFEFIEPTEEMRTLFQRVRYLDIQYHPWMITNKLDDGLLERIHWNVDTCEEDMRNFFKTCGFYEYYGEWNKNYEQYKK